MKNKLGILGSIEECIMEFHKVYQNLKIYE